MSELVAPPAGEVEVDELLERHGLAAKPVAVVYFSFSEPDSFVGAHDPDGRMTRLIEFMPLPVRGTDLLAAIQNIDDNGARLLDNYRRRFPMLHAEVDRFFAEEPRAETPALAWLLAASSIVIGLDDRDLQRATQGSQLGVKVDTVVIEAGDRYLFDGLRMLRSLMSYLIADVPRDVLARSIFESLGDFAADAVRRLLKDWQADAVVCAGDLFAGNNLLRVRTRGALIGMHIPMHFSPIMSS